MEEYELQEVEFWRKLEEESMSRNAMLRRSAAAALGLTVISSPAAAWAARVGGADALTADGTPLKALIKAAQKEGHLNVIALPHDWANYGSMISAFKKKYGLGMTEDDQGPAQARVQEQGRAERQPLDVELRGLRRVRGSPCQRRLAQQRPAGNRFLPRAEEGGQLHSGGRDAADCRVGPDPDRDRLGLPQPRLQEGVPRRPLDDGDPLRRRLRVVLLPGDQRIRAAPQRGQAVDGVPLLGSGAADLAEGVLASGAVPGSGEAQEDPIRAHQGAALSEALREGEVRERCTAESGEGEDRGRVARYLRH